MELSTSSVSDADVQLCEALGCGACATQQIEINVGKFGTLTLSVCINCVSKFTEQTPRGVQ